MRYWVYINGKVIEMPFEEGELSAIKGFNADTLVCKETPAAGETQEWMPAKMLIEAYKQPAPPPPPSRQIIEKFSPSSQNTVLKEPKGTILSSNIFGSTEKKEPEPQQNNTDAMFSQTEAIFPEEIEQENKELSEQEKLKKEIFSEPPTEVVSFDAVEEFDVDKHSDNSTESEEEILKTAIRTSISSKNIKKANTSVQAIDIINNNNIDISDEQEDEVKAENSEEKSAEKSEENAPKEEVDSQKDLSQTELTPLGDSEKKPLTRLFDSEPVVQEPAPTPQEQPVKEEQPIKEEIQEQNENPEDEFVPEEEISLGDEDLLIEDIKEEAPVLENNEPAPKEVQEVLQEFVKENQTQEKGKFEDTLKTSPALVADLAAEMPSNEFLPKQENNILDIQNQPDNIDEHPTTLEELTGRYPIEEEASSSKEQPAKEEQKTAPQEQENNISQEQQEEGIVIPAEIHPDVIVEEVKEEEPVKVEENIPSPETQTIADKDNFLNTFSSDIETVFLDQPTAFISDYIPPAETSEENNLQVMEAEQKEEKPEILDIKSDQGQHQVSLQNVRRVKPAAIKTVPMVDGEQQDPFSQTQIQHLHEAEVAMAKVERNNTYINLLKTFGLIFIFLLMLMGFVALVAQANIIHKDFSPIHALYAKFFGKKEQKVVKDKSLTPEEIALRDLQEAEVLRINKIISEVKNYQLAEGITLEEKIKKMHPNIFNQLTWEAKQEPNDLTYYSIKVYSPTNPEGYAQVNYRFSYNTVTYSVEATTSEANNLMIIPYQTSDKQNQ